jgi:hypothetical protein
MKMKRRKNMSNTIPDENPIQVRRTADEFIYYPPKTTTRIDEGDWNRWIYSIREIPKRDTIIRDIAFACFGVALPSFISGFVSLPEVSQLPNWVSIAYFALFTTTFIIGIVCMIFDNRLESHALVVCKNTSRYAGCSRWSGTIRGNDSNYNETAFAKD